jgi:CRISPR-associated protein Cmr4
MNMKIVGMLAETFVHPGSGQNVGAIDLPVAREAATGYPFMAGSSLKGALRDAYEKPGRDDAERIFGKQEHAGSLLVSDARLLLLPVRSLSSAYRWVTCTHLLERFGRDTRRSSGGEAGFEPPRVQDKQALSQGDGWLFLEERSFEISDAPGEDIIRSLERLIPDQGARERLPDQLTILSDNDFAWFARYGLAVQARNQLTGGKTTGPWKNPETGKEERGNLWYEETLPPDTLMYAVLAERDENGNDALQRVREIGDYLQAGGNETVGQGWFSLGWEVY